MKKLLSQRLLRLQAYLLGLGLGALPVAAVLALVLSLAVPGPSQAQTDQSYWVGAISKLQAANVVGAAPTVTVVATGGAAQTVAFATYGSSAYDITLTANITFTFTAPPAAASGGQGTGVRQSMFLHVRNTAGTWTMTWPGALKWSNGTVPTFVTTAGTQYLIEIVTDDAGATYTAKLL